MSEEQGQERRQEFKSVRFRTLFRYANEYNWKPLLLIERCDGIRRSRTVGEVEEHSRLSTHHSLAKTFQFDTRALEYNQPLKGAKSKPAY